MLELPLGSTWTNILYGRFQILLTDHPSLCAIDVGVSRVSLIEVVELLVKKLLARTHLWTVQIWQKKLHNFHRRNKPKGERSCPCKG